MLKFPKTQRMPGKMPGKKHRESILQKKDGTCYLCRKLDLNYRIHACVHKHHVFGGPNRKISEAEGLYIYLCPEHHVLGRDAVHREYEMMRMLQEDAQRVYERTHSREEFMKLIGRNYL